MPGEFLIFIFKNENESGQVVRGRGGVRRKLGVPLGRPVVLLVTPGRGRDGAGQGGEDTPSRGRGRPRGICAGCPRRAGPRRRLP